MNNQIFEIVNNWHKNKVVAVVVAFEDDTCVTIDVENKEVIELSGMLELSFEKKEAVQDGLKMTINEP